MRNSNFMAGSVKGTAENRKKANIIGNAISGVVIAAFLTTMFFVTRPTHYPELAEYSKIDETVGVGLAAADDEKQILFYTSDAESATIVNILDWAEHSYLEIDEFLATIIDSFDGEDEIEQSLGSLYASVYKDKSQQNSGSFETSSLYTRNDLINLRKTFGQ